MLLWPRRIVSFALSGLGEGASATGGLRPRLNTFAPLGLLLGASATGGFRPRLNTIAPLGLLLGASATGGLRPRLNTFAPLGLLLGASATGGLRPRLNTFAPLGLRAPGCGFPTSSSFLLISSYRLLPTAYCLLTTAFPSGRVGNLLPTILHHTSLSHSPTPRKSVGPHQSSSSSPSLTCRWNVLHGQSTGRVTSLCFTGFM
jgi:hypothetical protein